MSRPAQTPLGQLTENGPKIPAISFGLMGMSIGYGEAESDEERLEVLDRAWELGCTNWDTADIYGDSEDVAGKWFRLHPERRADIFLATKFGLKMEDSGMITNSSPEYVLESANKSLQRLGVDHIDLEGKVKYLGLSETLEIEGAPGTHLMKSCAELGIAIFAYSPLGRGILTGRFRTSDDFEEGDVRRNMARFQGENCQKNLKIVDTFHELAAKKGCTPSQLTLAWILEQSPNIFVIPGTKKIKYLEDN
ncbi:hypothetical protein LQW54_002173 [Pestalotiopsis sp. IQ-011]